MILNVLGFYFHQALLHVRVAYPDVHCRWPSVYLAHNPVKCLEHFTTQTKCCPLKSLSQPLTTTWTWSGRGHNLLAAVTLTVVFLVQGKRRCIGRMRTNDGRGDGNFSGKFGSRLRSFKNVLACYTNSGVFHLQSWHHFVTTILPETISWI